MEAQSIILIGRSGCGKGTQAKNLQAELAHLDKAAGSDRGVFYLQTGQHFREYIKGGSATQLICRDIYERGALTPEFLAILMWAKALSDGFNGTDHLIIDGSPRKLHEAGTMHSIFEFYKRTAKPHVIHMKITEDEAVKRLMGRKRLDDNPEDIRARLKWFETDVIPVVEFYRNHPGYHFIEIDGMLSPEEVYAVIKKEIGLGN